MTDTFDFFGRLVLFAVIHSALATPSVKTAAARISGPAFRGYRLAYNLLSVILFGWVVSAWQKPRVLYLVPGSLMLACYLAQAILFFSLCICAGRVGLGELLGFAQMRGRESENVLVTDGCYGLVRHPLYSISVFICVLNPVMTDKWLFFTLFAAGYFVVGAIVEEKRLVREFGEGYQDYRRQVPMFLPRLGRSPSTGSDRRRSRS